MTTTHFAEPGPLHRDPELPLFAPRVYKIGQKASDMRFLAEGYVGGAILPANDVYAIEAENRFIAFDKQGELMEFTNDISSHGSLFPHNNPTAESVSVHADFVYLAVFTVSQMAEFLERFDGKKNNVRGRGEPFYKFTRPPPIQVIEMLNPHTEEVEPVVVLASVPEFSKIAKVVGKLIDIDRSFRTEHILNLAVCANEIFSLDSKYHHETDPEKKGLALAAVDAAKAEYSNLIPDEAKAFHDLTTDPRVASATRAELHTFFYESRPSHISALALVAKRALTNKTETPS